MTRTGNGGLSVTHDLETDDVIDHGRAAAALATVLAGDIDDHSRSPARGRGR